MNGVTQIELRLSWGGLAAFQSQRVNAPQLSVADAVTVQTVARPDSSLVSFRISPDDAEHGSAIASGFYVKV